MATLQILIPNATSAKNLGDQAMLEVLISLIRKKHPRGHITVQAVDYQNQKPGSDITYAPSLVHWLLFTNANIFSRVLALAQILFRLVFPSLSLSMPVDSIVNAYRSADMIYFVGNGYLRSQKGIAQGIYLMIMLLPYLVVSRLGKTGYLSPMGFGPFAYPWQTEMVAHVLRAFPLIHIREPISSTYAKRAGLHSVRLSWDHAFGTAKAGIAHRSVGTKLRIGVAIRSWKSSIPQDVFERILFESLKRFSTKTSVILIPIIQANAPQHHDDDALVARRLYAFAKLNGVQTVHPINLSSVSHAASVYRSLSFLIGMRMHANIIALSQGTPVVAIAYEHKTTGIMRMLRLSAYSISMELVTARRLHDTLTLVKRNQNRYRAHIKQNLIDIRRKINRDFS